MMTIYNELVLLVSKKKPKWQRVTGFTSLAASSKIRLAYKHSLWVKLLPMIHSAGIGKKPDVRPTLTLGHDVVTHKKPSPAAHTLYTLMDFRWVFSQKVPV